MKLGVLYNVSDIIYNLLKNNLRYDNDITYNKINIFLKYDQVI